MWFKVDDTLHAHPKARRAGLQAIGLWAMAGSWCMSYKTDGFVPDWFVRGWPDGPDLARELVDAGLWSQAVQDLQKGWSYHDWGHYQPSSEEIERERVASRDRQRKRRAMLRGEDPDVA